MEIGCRVFFDNNNRRFFLFLVFSKIDFKRSSKIISLLFSTSNNIGLNLNEPLSTPDNHKFLSDFF
jgi:hypothetical protein